MKCRDICKKQKIIPFLHKLFSSENPELVRNSVGIFTAICVDPELAKEMHELDGFKGIVKCLEHEDRYVYKIDITQI